MPPDICSVRFEKRTHQLRLTDYHHADVGQKIHGHPPLSKVLRYVKNVFTFPSLRAYWLSAQLKWLLKVHKQAREVGCVLWAAV